MIVKQDRIKNSLVVYRKDKGDLRIAVKGGTAGERLEQREAVYRVVKALHKLNAAPVRLICIDCRTRTQVQSKKCKECLNV